MLQTAQTSNPNDYKVVSFHNKEVFDFTPDLGCMYDGRAVNGASGAPGIQAGETVILPYHIAHQLAKNLAKRVFNTSPAATVDPAGIPTGVPVWNETKLNDLKLTYLKDLYTEAKPIMQSDTDKLLAKVEEYKSMVDQLLGQKNSKLTEEKVSEVVPELSGSPKITKEGYQDKQEVIAELEKRGIPHDKRLKKVDLEKLLK